MMQRSLAIIYLLTLPVFLTHAQQKIGINTPSPYRTLHVNGTGHQYIRIRSTSQANAWAGFELVRSFNGFPSTDWRIANSDGDLKIQYADDNFTTPGTEALRITSGGNTGIGTNAPVSVLHIDGGSQLHNAAGYLRLSGPLSEYLVFDNNGISARDGNTHSELLIQNNGGNTYFGSSGGNTYLVQGGGFVGIGTASPNAPLSIADAGFQLYLRNQAGGSINDWHIGASNNTWVAGDNQLLFSPTSSSSDAVFRLRSVTENDGNNAPVMIHTTSDQTILLDGNEIDTRGAPLHINHNSGNNTYLNPSGGLVGIGTDNPSAALHLVAPAGIAPLYLQRNNNNFGTDWIWSITPTAAGNNNLSFIGNGVLAGQIDGVNGQWITFSDARYKENIIPIRDVLGDLMTIAVSSYSFLHDPTHTTSIGLMAQDLLPVFPEIVREHNDQYGVVYAQLSIIALKAIQEQQEYIDNLRSKIAFAKEQKSSKAAHSSH